MRQPGRGSKPGRCLARLCCRILLCALLSSGSASWADDEGSAPLGGWAPPADLLETARALGAGVAEARKAAVQRIESLPAAERVRVLRAGLRLPDGLAARACAARLRWTEVDDAESARIVRLGLLDSLEPGSEFEFDEVRSLLGSTELEPLLERLAREPRVASAERILGDVHRQVRAVHVPSLCRLALVQEEGLAREGLSVLRIAVGYTDQHREDVARALVALGPWPTQSGPERAPGAPRARPVQLAAKPTGWPAALAAVVDALWLEGARAPDWTWEIDRWALRWLHEAPTSAEDLGLLGALVSLGLASGNAPLLRACVAALGRSDEPAVTPLLERIAAGNDEDDAAGLFAVAALAQRGDVAMRERLFAGARRADAVLPLALAACVDPQAGGRLLRERLLSPDPATALVALQTVDASRYSRGVLYDGPVIPPQAYAGLEAAALASDLPGLALARLGSRVPACRTARVAREALARLAHAPADDELSAHGGADGVLARDFAFLEVTDGDALRRVLRAWAAGTDTSRSTSRELALLALLLLGDPESGERLAAWVESGAADAADGREVPPILLLARSAGPAVTAYVDGKLAASAATWTWAAKAALAGLPEPVALAIADAFDPAAGDEAARQTRERLVREGKVVDLVLAWCFGEEVGCLADVGLVRDPHIVAALRRVREARERGLYVWATSQLMLAGDAEATVELDRAFSAGRYRWIDTTDPRILSLGGRLSRLPAWIDELESNCCRVNPILEIFSGGAVRALVDVPDPRVASTRWTPAAILRRSWAEDGGEVQPFSRLAGVHVPVVR